MKTIKYISAFFAFFALSALYAQEKDTAVIQTVKQNKRTGLAFDFSVGLPIAAGSAGNYADRPRSAAFDAKLYYNFNKGFKAGILFQNRSFTAKKNLITLVDESGYYNISGIAVNAANSFGIMAGGEYSYRFNRYAQPYAGLYLGVNIMDTTTQIGTYLSYPYSKWMFTLQPELGFRSYFDRNEVFGAILKAGFTQSLGKMRQVNGEIKNPAYLNISLGVSFRF